ncbi:transmembrane protein, putative (macronuclear) [Tetrahymena thermophila SB210]|uniref:Transmembrane protein, putative n=1 Tax=Tetrahymena thermophila (strain SB210) TaxID=312017 RepID=Q24F00_TETTS|nr:transmembrane protein, putative [Tetrahymena thermophila SB210]EAS06355.2 transmembrane protein, putative [Tetrahymena thermophila SB210]|eukprot:XP_001026600.2 transmembrane protein, putative [Tetrahymena thermophila SB210]
MIKEEKEDCSVIYEFEDINANFEGLNLRFIIILQGTNYCKINIMDCQFKNMKSLDSGGCFSNQASAVLIFTNTVFDSCQSGMFGGALYSSSLKVTDQLIIKNSKSKIGGGAFLGSQSCAGNVNDLEKINFFNDSNAATISSQQYFKCTNQPDYNKMPSCNLFELDSIFQLNTELVNTQYYQVQSEVKIKDMGSFPIIYYSTLFQNMIYVLRLRVEYQCPEKQLPQICSIREFNEDQSIGNLYNFIDDNEKQYFYNFEIPNANYPYLLTSYSEYFDCKLKGYAFIFRLHLLIKDSSFCTLNTRKGCYNPTNLCIQGMQQIFNLQQQQMQCKYCDIGTFKDQSTDRCEVCSTEKFDKCYANDSYLKQNFWRPYNSNYNDIYFCQLNQKSCQGSNRSGYGNDLCSEGYIGAQCLTCDINGEFWNGQYGQQGYFQCVKCSSLSNNDTFVYLSLATILFVFFFTIISSFRRMRKQVYRRYLSFYMKKIYIGSSFIRQSQASVYTKILMFNFQMYLLTYYFVDFEKYDSSIHSNIYNLFNPLQNSGGISQDCFLKQYFPTSENLGFIKLLISIISPLILNIFFWLILSLYSQKKKKFYNFLMINSFTYSIIFIFQSPIIQYSVESLTCIKLSSNEEYLMINTRINCKDNYWISKMTYLSIGALIFYILFIPIYIFRYIFVNRKKLENSKMLIAFGFIYDEYKRQYYYWQFIKLLLTTLLSVLVSFGKTHIILCCQIYCAILCIYSVFLIFCKPFQQISMNKVELVSIILSVLYFLSSISLQLEFSSENQYDQYQVGRIMSEIFYYLVLICQFIFYLYIICLIILSVFYTSVQKLQKFQIFQRLLRLFPRAKLKVYTKDLEINLQRFRQLVRGIIMDQSTNLIADEIQTFLVQEYEINLQ